MTAMPGQNCGLKTTAARMGRLTPPQIKANHQPWKIHRRVEPICGIQQMGAGNWMIGSRGLARAKAKIGWRNLTYNIAPILPAGPTLVASGAASRRKSQPCRLVAALMAAVLRQIIVILPEAIQF
ncbi:hypothetical protein CMK14_19050 [Candidatus Poribacteria bacterium]|nr:hypothetical protein [Candidatus Poribacteria bacterium]